MRNGIRAAIAASVLWAALLQPVPAASPRAASGSLQLPRQLSSDNVLAILLLLLSREDAEMRPALRALYEASYISTEPSGGKALERYVTQTYLAPYKDDVTGSVFAALMAYQKLIAAEMREDRRLMMAQLRASTVRIAGELPAPALAQFVEKAGAWLQTLDAALRATGDGELVMLQLQELISQRSRAIALVTSLMQSLHDAARQVAANLGPSPPTQSEGSSRGDGTRACAHCSP